MKTILSNSPIDPNNPRNASDVNWVKAERMGGRKDKGDRTRDEGFGGGN